MKDKETKTVIRWVMAISVIAILFIPAVAVYEIEARTETHILSVEGLYTNGTVFSTYEPVDKIQIANMFSAETVILDQDNNDSYYAKNNQIAYTNFVTYIGNGTYSVTPNYTIHHPFVGNLEIAVPLNITTHELAEFDFIRLFSNDEHSWRYIVFNHAFNGWKEYLWFEEIRADTHIMIMSLSIKNWLLSAPNENVYVVYNAINPTDITWNFKVIGFNLDTIHQFSWDDKQLYIVSLLIVAGIITPLAILSSKTIDLKLDKGKPGGKR